MNKKLVAFISAIFIAIIASLTWWRTSPVDEIRKVKLEAVTLY